MASFDLYAPTLLYWETGVKTTGLSGAAAFEKSRARGFVNDPYDKGGATQSGITLGTFRMYFGSRLTVEDLKNITYTQWRFIMKRYWDRCKGDEIVNQSIAEIFVDWHINAGNSAVRRMQIAFGLKSDGIVGSRTLAALNGENPSHVFSKVKNARISYYNKLAITTPSNARFLRGWLNRTESFKFQ